MIHQAVEAELQDLLAEHAQQRTAEGKMAVVRNGYLPEREIQTGIGPVTVQIPKVRSRPGEPITFRSALVHRMCVRQITGSGPAWLYLKGISTGEMQCGPASAGGPGGSRPVGKHGCPPEAGVGRRIPGLAYRTIRQRLLGLCVGGRGSTVASGQRMRSCVLWSLSA